MFNIICISTSMKHANAQKMWDREPKYNKKNDL
jgi:hypothetical protein